MTDIVATLVRDLREFADRDASPQFVGFGTRGDWAVARRRSSERSWFERGIGRFPKTELDEPTDYDVQLFQGGSLFASTKIRGERTSYHFALPHPDGLLMVGARCAFKNGSAEQNAALFSAEGRLLRRMTLGDGIQDVRVSPNGKIWVSYFDEGVFGNYGWGSAEGPRPVGKSGLVRFDATGHPELEFDSTAAGTDAICDAYAFNLADEDDAWICFYTEFPIVHLAAGTYRAWSQEHHGACAIAVKGSRALLVGGDNDPAAAREVALGSSSAVMLKEGRRIVGPAGEDFTAALFAGVGDRVYVLSEDRLYVALGW